LRGNEDFAELLVPRREHNRYGGEAANRVLKEMPSDEHFLHIARSLARHFSPYGENVTLLTAHSIKCVARLQEIKKARRKYSVSFFQASSLIHDLDSMDFIGSCLFYAQGFTR
jgi:hypothetical protein